MLIALTATSQARAGRGADAELGALLASLDDAAPGDGDPVQALVDQLADTGPAAEPPPPGHSHAQSVGRPQAGYLVDGSQLPNHAGYQIRDPGRAWASDVTVAWLTRAFDQLRAIDPLAPLLMVHDLSLPFGGPMDGHGSHQSGRDVDLAYYRSHCERVCRARPLAPSELDATRQWRLLGQWLRRGQAELIFVDYALQAPLYRAARQDGASAEELHSWFQYPSGPDCSRGVVRHWPNHKNHVHVRFRCAADDPSCSGRRVGPHGSDGQHDTDLFDLLDDEGEASVIDRLANDD